MVSAQSRAQNLQRATDVRQRDNRHNKLNRASPQSTLTAYWPKLIPPSLPIRPSTRPILPPQPNNLHSYGWKPDLNFRIRIHISPPVEYPFHHYSLSRPAGNVHHKHTYWLAPWLAPTHPTLRL